MRGSLGLVIGFVVGAGGMYLGLQRPWAHHASAPGDAAVVASVPGHRGKSHRHRHHHHYRHYRRHRRGAGPLTSGDDSSWTTGGDTPQDTAPKLVPLTAADRALEWRGDRTTKPREHIDMSKPGAARPLDQGEIQHTIETQSGAVQHCVVEAATNTDLSGTITVRMVVAGSGHVIRSKVEAPHYLFVHGLLRCVQSALGHVHFPATGMATLVTMPIHFS